MSCEFYKPGFLKVIQHSPFIAAAHPCSHHMMNSLCCGLAAGSGLCAGPLTTTGFVYIGVKEMDVIVCYSEVLFGFYHSC